MTTLVGKKAPSFEASAVINGGEIVQNFSLEQYIGKRSDFILLSKRFYFCLPFRIACVSRCNGRF